MSKPREPDWRKGAAETTRKTKPSAMTPPLFSFHNIALNFALFFNISRNKESDNLFSCLSLFIVNRLFLHLMPWQFFQDFLQKCFCDLFRSLQYKFCVSQLYSLISPA